MTRARRKSKPDPIDLALSLIIGYLNLRSSARQSAEVKLRERANARLQSLGEYREFVERRP